MNPSVIFEYKQKIEQLIESGPIDELIAYAKEYNIHQENGVKSYRDQVDKIKQRLISEGIDPDTVRSV